jgi:hypothetical protein
MSRIDSFRGEYFFLSNFYPEADGKTLEHRFQAAKTSNPEASRLIFDSASPYQARSMGGRAVELRSDWDSSKVEIMRDLLRAKFADPELRNLLCPTGEAELAEGNTWNDHFWGVCRGSGQNWLGRLLMELRSELGR